MPSLIDTYISAIKEKSKRRKIRAAASELYNAAQDGDKSLDELTAEFAHRIDALAEIEGGTVSAWDAVFALINEIDKKDDNKGVIGIPLLDQALGGMSGGRLYVVGARPGDRQDGAGNIGGVQHGGLWRGAVLLIRDAAERNHGAHLGKVEQGKQSGHQLSEH